jgi:hypothetical protein
MLRGTGVAGTAAITGGNTWFVAASSFVPVSAPNDTTADTLATINLPPLSANAIVRVTSIWTVTNSANSKTLAVKFSGSGGTNYFAQSFTTVATVVDVRIFGNRGATNSQVGSPSANAVPGSYSSSVVTSSVDTTAATSIVFTGQKALGSETITLEGYLVEVYKP